jgi:hypothetical protein
VDINHFGEIFALAYRTVPLSSEVTDYNKGLAFMLFSPMGSFLKAEYYDFSFSSVYKYFGFNKARFIGSNRRQVAIMSIIVGSNTPIAIYNIDNSTIT